VKGDEKLDVKNPRHSTKKERFLRAISKCGVVTTAAKWAKVSATVHYRWMSDPEYAERFEAAREAAIEALETVLYREARKANVPLLIFALKALRPEVYRENSRVELTGLNGRPIKTQTNLRSEEAVTLLSDAELLQIIAAGYTPEELRELKEASLETAVIPAPLLIAAPLPLEQCDGG
jgi:hypothetical protein